VSKRRKRRRTQSAAPPKFTMGQHVRVRQGIKDKDYPDIPLGGWVGVISEVHRRGKYTVRWRRDTLENIHPVYRKRCARDGTVLEEYWLHEDHLEADPGGPLSIEQPTAITPRPLSRANQGDRIRMVFGLSSDDLLPAVTEESLETYYAYLDEKLSLPLKACYLEEYRHPFVLSGRTVTVAALGTDFDLDEDEGIFCEVHGGKGEELVPLADLAILRSDPNYRLVSDYSAWFFGDLPEELEDYDEDPEDHDDQPQSMDEEASPILEVASWRSVALLALEIIAFAASFGAVAGAAVAAMPWAKWAACLGGGLLGIFPAAFEIRRAERDMSFVRPAIRRLFAGVIGLVVGAVPGAFFGIMAVAFIGASVGGVAGLLFRRLLRGKRVLRLHVFPGSVLSGAACGVAAQALYVHRIEATAGICHGALVGLACGLVFCAGVPLLLYLTVRKRRSA
jgi:hypothetical protein